MLNILFWVAVSFALLTLAVALRGGRPTARALATAAMLASLGGLPAVFLTWRLGDLAPWDLSVGLSIALGQVLLALRHLRQPFAHAEPVRDAGPLAALARLAAAAGLRRTPALLRHRTLGALPAWAWVVRLHEPTVVLADGVVHRLEPPEVEAVLAHEVAHVASGSLWWFVLPAPLCAAAALALMPWIGAFGALGLSWVLASGAQRIVSRRIEIACDRRAAALTTPTAMVSALRRMHTLHPMRDPGWRSALAWGLASHPHLEERAHALGLGDAALARPYACASRAAFAAWGLGVGGALALALAGGPAADVGATAVWVGLAVGLALSARVATRAARRRLRRLAPDLTPGRRCAGYGWSLVAAGLIAGVADLSAILGVLAALLGCTLVGFARWQARGNKILRQRLSERLQRLDLPGAFALGLDASPVLRRDPALRLDWALVALAAGERAEGMAALEDLTRRAPRLLTAPLSLGVALLEERPERSLELGRIVGARAPDLPDGPLLEVRALRRLGRGAEARGVWERAAAIGPDEPGVITQALELALDRGDLPEAAALEARGRDRFPGDLGLLLAAVRLELARGARDLARALLDRAERLRADQPFSFLDWRVAELNALLAEADAVEAR